MDRFEADFDDELSEAPASPAMAEPDLDQLRSMPPPPASRSAPPSPGYARPAAPKKRKAEIADKDVAATQGPTASAYLVNLGMLARELEAHAGGPNATAIRMLRQRLTEWVEDLRSVGSDGALADAVEKLVERLTAALAGTDLATEAKAIAHELQQLAGGAPPPAPAKKSRLAFWK